MSKSPDNLVAEIQRRFEVDDVDLAQLCGVTKQTVQKVRLGLHPMSKRFESSLRLAEKSLQHTASERAGWLKSMLKKSGLGKARFARLLELTTAELDDMLNAVTPIPDKIRWKVDQVAATDWEDRPEAFPDGEASARKGTNPPDAEALEAAIHDHIDRFVSHCDGQISRLGWTLEELQSKFPLKKWGR